MLDRACKDKANKEFDADFKLELFLDRVDELPAEFDHLNTKGTYLEADNDDDLNEGEDD